MTDEATWGDTEDDPDVLAALAEEAGRKDVPDNEIIGPLSVGPSAADFKAAGGATASNPPVPSDTNSGTSIFVIQTMIEIQDMCGLTFPGEITPKVAAALKQLLTDMIWPEEEAFRLELIRLVLRALGNKTAGLERAKYQSLLDVFFKEMEKHPVLCTKVQVLRDTVPKRQLPPPLPLPKSIMPRPPKR